MQVLSIGKKKRVYAIAFSPNGEELATVSGDLRFRVWNLATGEARLSERLIRQTPSGYALAYLDRERIVLAGADIDWWEPATDQWHPISTGYLWGRQLKLSPDSALLFEVDQARSTEWTGNGLRVYTTADWSVQPTMPDAANTTGGIAFSSDGALLATGHIARVGERAHTIGTLLGQQTSIQIQVPEYDYLVHVREMPSGRVVQSIGGWQQAVTHLAFSPNGAVLAGTAGPRLRVWDLREKRELALHKRGPKHFQGLSFARDGSAFATVSNDATVRIWDARTWQEHTTFTWDIGALLNISFAPDGLRAAAGSDKGQIVIWDVE